MTENLISGFADSLKPMITPLLRWAETEYTLVYKKDLRLLEEINKVKDGYFPYSLDNGFYLISPEIKDKLKLNGLFAEVLTTAIYEIIYILDAKIGKEKYIIEVDIIHDYEYPDWINNVITIKTTIKDPRYIIQLWKITSDNVWKKVRLIKKDTEEIKKIIYNTRIAFDILE